MAGGIGEKFTTYRTCLDGWMQSLNGSGWHLRKRKKRVSSRWSWKQAVADRILQLAQIITRPRKRLPSSFRRTITYGRNFAKPCSGFATLGLLNSPTMAASIGWTHRLTILRPRRPPTMAGLLFRRLAKLFELYGFATRCCLAT